MLAQAAITECHRLWGFSSKRLSCIALEAGNPKSRCQNARFWVKAFVVGGLELSLPPSTSREETGLEFESVTDSQGFNQL